MITEVFLWALRIKIKIKKNKNQNRSFQGLKKMPPKIFFVTRVFPYYLGESTIFDNFLYHTSDSNNLLNLRELYFLTPLWVDQKREHTQKFFNKEGNCNLQFPQNWKWERATKEGVETCLLGRMISNIIQLKRKKCNK